MATNPDRLAKALAGIDAARVPRVLKRIDDVLGDLSYPVFLCHWLAALLTTWIFFGGQRPPGGTLFWGSLLGIHGIGWLIHVIVERPVERLRNTIRPTTDR